MTKPRRRIFLVLIPSALAALCIFRISAQGRSQKSPDDSGIVVSGYGHLESFRSDGTATVLPLRHTDVNGEIVGVVSTVHVQQKFVNPSSEPIEAVYVFPLPHHAAVYAMTTRIGDRVLQAKVEERERARSIYEHAKRTGRTASLLDQERPNLFTQSIANIRPGDEIDVSIHYVEELMPRDGHYQFVFPMVVGPRYVSQATGESGLGGPYVSRDDRPGHDISVSLRIDPGAELADLRAHTHDVKVHRESAQVATLQLADHDRVPNRDFVVSYAVGGPKPRATIMVNRDEHGAHFLLSLYPRLQMTENDSAPREYVFVVDTSGSMHGVPLQRAQMVLRRALTALRSNDRFQIIRFDTHAEPFAPQPLPPTRFSIDEALHFLDGLQAGGGTEFLPALDLAFRAKSDPSRARIVVFLTDGYIGYEGQVLAHIRKHAGRSSVFSVGIGASVNRYLIDGMARIGHGEPFVVLNRDNPEVVMERLLTTISRPALTHIQVDWGGLHVCDVTPAAPPDVFADRPLTLSGRICHAGNAEVTVRGLVAGKPYVEKLAVTLPDQPASGPALSYLWARRMLTELDDIYDTESSGGQSREVKRHITDIALAYNLMSRFTSFVAVDQQVRSAPGRTPRPAPVATSLPDGVSHHAVASNTFIFGSLSQDQIVPGDPEVRIVAPADAIGVTLILPTGELIPCSRDPRTGEWVANFLVAEGTPDGIYEIRVVITRFGVGEQLVRMLRYQIDSAAPRTVARLEAAEVAPSAPVHLIVEPVDQRLPLVDKANGDIGDPTFAARVREEAQVVEAQLPSGETAPLHPEPSGRFVLRFSAPTAAGDYPIRVISRDAAHNKTIHTLTLRVIAR